MEKTNIKLTLTISTIAMSIILGFCFIAIRA